MTKKNLFVPQLQNTTRRSSFDLSRRVINSAKAGELLPCYVLDCLPGDKVKISSNLFTRLANLNTSNFARMKQYVNFYFVPYRLLFRDFPAFIVNQSEAAKQASSILSSHDVKDRLPFVHSNDLFKYFASYVPLDSNGDIPAGEFEHLNLSSTFTPCSINHDSFRVIRDTYLQNSPSTAQVGKYILNRFGINRFDNSLKLLQYLGYYSFAARQSLTNSDNSTDCLLNIFPLLAYQKVYCDFYRFQQWESDQPQTYNIDYLSGSTTNEVPISQLFRTFGGYLHQGSKSQPCSFYGFNNQDETLFDLRYVNMIKDTLFGVVPSAQFGAHSTVNSPIDKVSSAALALGSTNLGIKARDGKSASNLFLGSTADSKQYRDVSYQADGPITGATPGSFEITTNSDGKNIFSSDGLISRLSTTFSIVQLRQAQALQKFREISLSNDTDYKSQIEAHFGVKVSSLMSSMCDYLGGFSADVNMSTITNTNLVDSGSVANYSAIGSMSGNGDIDFTCREHGIILGVSYVLPIIDIQPFGFEPLVLRTEFEDFALPEFDRLGNEEVDPRIFLGPLTKDGTIPHLGYGPRYYDYKTTFDIVLGDFNSISGGTQPNFVVNFSNFPFDGQNLDILLHANLNSIFSPTIYDSIVSNKVDAYSFKVRPYFLNNIFHRFCGNGNDDFSFDQFYNVFDFNVQIIRNLDYSGMPY